MIDTKSMKNNINGFPGATQVAAEIEALHQEIATLKLQIKDLVIVTNNNKEVLFDLLEALKNPASVNLLWLTFPPKSFILKVWKITTQRWIDSRSLSISRRLAVKTS